MPRKIEVEDCLEVILKDGTNKRIVVLIENFGTYSKITIRRTKAKAEAEIIVSKGGFHFKVLK